MGEIGNEPAVRPLDKVDLIFPDKRWRSDDSASVGSFNLACGLVRLLDDWSISRRRRSFNERRKLVSLHNGRPLEVALLRIALFVAEPVPLQPHLVIEMRTTNDNTNPLPPTADPSILIFGTV